MKDFENKVFNTSNFQFEDFDIYSGFAETFVLKSFKVRENEI